MNFWKKSRLINPKGSLWKEATEANFLESIGKGNLPEEAFNRWLEQDYHFAKGLTTFQAISAGKTPRPAQSTLIAGLQAMDAELGWFENKAKERNLTPGSIRSSDMSTLYRLFDRIGLYEIV